MLLENAFVYLSTKRLLTLLVERALVTHPQVNVSHKFLRL